MKKLFIISLGGSLINPGQINVLFLRNFKKLILAEVKNGSRFVIITGGGRPARDYISALKAVGITTPNEQDWMGIAATKLNAALVKLIFRKWSHPEIVQNPNIKVNFKEKILISGGWMPGRSTDDDAVRLAKAYGSQNIINLSNIDYVYTQDPRKFKDAQPIKKISWKNFRKIVGNKWLPGKNFPFDPTAAIMAEKLKMTVVIANGKNLQNLRNILRQKNIIGTTIK